MVFARVLINFHMDFITMELVSDLCVVLFILETFKCMKYTFNLNRGEIYSEHFNNKPKIDRFFCNCSRILKKILLFRTFYSEYFILFLFSVSC